LRRIQELTNEGLNLVGVKKVMDLEERISRLETEITSLQSSTEASLAEVHRQYRRDLVPMQQAPVPWLDPKRKQF
jgi:MerR family transcriptional regulator/heat shock protein HspR